MKLLILLLGCMIGAAGAQTMNQQATKVDVRQATEAAGRSLDTLAKLVTEDNYSAMGFESAREAADAALGPPMPVYLVQLDELREYDGSDPAALLKPLEQVMFPVVSGGATRSGITVENTGDGWKATGFGSAQLTQAIDRASKAAGATDPVVVHVAALRTYFVAHNDADGILQFTPVRDEPELEFRAGASVQADQALLALKPVAQRYNGLPL